MSKLTDFLEKMLPSEDTVGNLLYTKGKLDLGKLGGVLGAAGGAFGLFSSNQQPVGYQGSIPEYTAVRQRVPATNDPTRRPGSGGQRYFSDVSFAPSEGIASAQTTATTQAEGLKALNVANPSRQDRPASVIPDVPVTQGITTAANTSTPMTTVQDLLTIANPYTGGYGTPYKMAAGGIAQLKKGRYLDGDTDGMADEIPATIDNEQPAMLSDGEFVIPADVVSHLGNGNSDAGAKELEGMMDRVRKARTGTTKQGPEIDPKKFLPA
jgi:hypothetical protein|tara:strand:+ start:1690 stop:2490 length:801 start_codon:yes stop_codon:yes gene_type:complete